VAISDTGVGIPKKHLQKIFDPGFTTKGVGVGTGLGLPISFKIIQNHKGEIQVKSETGKGTTFTVVLPMNLKELLESDTADRAELYDRE
jgi:signal transduction histidine kinase